MPSYQVISDCKPGGEHKSYLEPQTLYVALHDRVKDALGEFHWGIVLTLSGGAPTYYHVNNTHEESPADSLWLYEQMGPNGDWDVHESTKLLVLYKVGPYDNPSYNSTWLGTFMGICRDEPTPSNGQPLDLQVGEWFSSQTWVRGVLQKVFNMGLLPSTYQVSEASMTEAARDYKKGLKKKGKPIESGWFRIVQSR